LALYRLEALIRKKQLASKCRPFKYHLIAIVRMQIAGVAPPPMTSNSFERYCKSIVSVLKDEKKCSTAYQRALDVLDDVLGGDFGRDRAKDASLLALAERACRIAENANLEA
jgi:hypothetical protein